MTRIISIVGGLQPTTPTIGTATGGDTTASVAFTPSTYIGKGTITYTATSSPGSFTATNSTTPISITGLSNGTAYTFTVFGTTNYGVLSATSAASNSVTPAPTGPTTTKGYYAGGLNSNNNTTSIYKYNFPTDAVSTLGATLTQGRYQLGGLSNYSDATYFLNGYIAGAGETQVTEKFTHSNETVAAIANTAVQAESGNITNSGTAGYQICGYNGGDLSQRRKYPYATLTPASLSAAPLTSRLILNGNNIGVRGYFGGGTGGSAQIYYLDFSNDTTGTITTSNGGGPWFQAAVNNEGTAMYGFQYQADPPTVPMAKMPFSTETNAAIAATMAKAANTGTTYIGSFGVLNHSAFTTVQKISYSTDTLSSGTGFPAAKSEPFTASAS